MSRVLLFVQTGDARPKVHHRLPGQKHEWKRDWRPEWCQSRAERIGADSWWLVECENADDGRTVIMQERVFDGTGIHSTLGRILASGGKR